MNRKVILTILLLTLFSSISSIPNSPLTAQSEVPELSMANSVIVINETQYTWYGDFIVNETDTVIIENCNFTVVDGSIWVHGELQILNSTVHIQKSTYRKRIYVCGSLNLSCSCLAGTGDIMVTGYNAGSVLIDNSTLTSWYVGALVCTAQKTIHILNSKLDCVYAVGRDPLQVSFYISNSEVISSVSLFLPGPNDTYTLSAEISNSSIEEFAIHQRGNNVKFENINKGKIENWVYSYGQTNLTITHSIVNTWSVRAQTSQNLYLLNSNVSDVELVLGTGPGNLTLKPGFFQYENIYAENVINVTISNSTIDSWSCLGSGGALQFSNSDFSLYLYVAHDQTSSHVVISNSTMSWLITETSFRGSLIIMDSEVDVFEQRYTTGCLDLVLQPCYHDYLNFYNEQRNSNVTMLRTTVDYWSFEALSGATLNIYNSTLPSTYAHPPTHRPGLHGYGGKVYVYNSSLELVKAQYNSSLTLVNSTVQLLYAYENSNITAINSTIHTLIKDPPTLTFINTQLLADILLSFQLPDEALSVCMQDVCEIPLPSKIECVSKYLQINSTYDDIVDAQIRIYYNETETEEVGIDERNLRMYCLEESSSSWQPCSIQGVNTTENCVWANVTHFSVFVLGFRETYTYTPWQVVRECKHTNYIHGWTIVCYVELARRTCTPYGCARQYAIWRFCDIY